MRKITSLISLPFLLPVLLLLSSCQTHPDIYGSWSGIFMDHYSIELEFVQSGKNQVTGFVRLFDGEQQFQNDLLTRIKSNRDQFSFYIEAKQTTFIGAIEGNTIEGYFTFPDGSRHKLLVERVVESQNQDGRISTRKLTVAQQKRDLEFVKDQLLKLHPNLQSEERRQLFEERYTRAVSKIIHDQDVLEFYNIVAPFLAALNCSHTGVRLSPACENELKPESIYFPARLFFDDSATYFVSLKYADPTIPEGTEIFTINNHLVSEIKALVFKYIASESTDLSRRYFEINNRFPEYFLTIDPNTSFLVSLTDTSGVRRTTVLEACNFEGVRSLYPKSDDFKPEFLPRLTRYDDINTVVLEYNSFAYRDIAAYNKFHDSLFSAIAGTSSINLVLDLRGNAGGHPLFAAQLLSYLVNEPFQYFEKTDPVEEFLPLYDAINPSPFAFDGQVFVLTDGGCLSTTGHFIAQLKSRTNAVFIGQEPGSSLSCNDKSVQFSLPESKLEMNVPTHTFRVDAAEFLNPDSIVDYPVTPTLSAQLKGEDQVMSKVLELIEKGSSDKRSQSISLSAL